MMTEFFVRLLTKAGPAWLVGRWAFHPIAACRASATPGLLLGFGSAVRCLSQTEAFLVSFPVVSYRIVSYRVVSYRGVCAELVL